jgi:cysteinyl-tRNA synthetase
LALFKLLAEKKADIHAALCDSIDTRTVMEKIRELINSSNIYIRDNPEPSAQLLKLIAEYITSLMKIFGVIPESTQLGYPADERYVVG